MLEREASSAQHSESIQSHKLIKIHKLLIHELILLLQGESVMPCLDMRHSRMLAE